MPNNIFISHVSEEAETASRIKLALEADFLGLVEIFVSSDAQSIAAGEQWLSSIDAALRDASILLILCSPDSITRSWINFEAGAAWMRQIPLIPVCHGGLSAGDLPMPLSLRQGIELNNADGLQRLYTRVASVLQCRVPNRSFDELAHTLSGRAVNRGLDDEADIRDRLNKALNHRIVGVRFGDSLVQLRFLRMQPHAYSAETPPFASVITRRVKSSLVSSLA